MHSVLRGGRGRLQLRFNRVVLVLGEWQNLHAGWTDLDLNGRGHGGADGSARGRESDRAGDQVDFKRVAGSVWFADELGAANSEAADWRVDVDVFGVPLRDQSADILKGSLKDAVARGVGAVATGIVDVVVDEQLGIFADRELRVVA